MRILGIDPGSRITGFGVVEVVGDQYRCITQGSIRLGEQSFNLRLKTIFSTIHEVMTTFAPQAVAIEQVFMHKNPDAALKLGQARGAALAAVLQHTTEVAEYSARQIKQSMVGYGNAEKKQVLHMVSLLLQVPKEELTPDAADALATAVCHAHARQSRVHLLEQNTTNQVAWRLPRRSSHARGRWR